jgi:PQQ-like domain
MSDVKTLLERKSLEFDPEPGGFARLANRRRVRRRNQRIMSALLALAIAFGGLGMILFALRDRPPGHQVPGGIGRSNVHLLRETWSAATRSAVESMLVDDGVLLVQTDDFTLVAYDASCAGRGDGCRPLWTAAIREASWAGMRPVAADGFVYVSTQGRLLAYDLRCRDDGETCEPAWTANVFVTTDPLVTADLVVVGATDGLYAFPKACASGGGGCEPAWTAPIPLGVNGILPQLRRGTIDVVSGALSSRPQDVKSYEFPENCGNGGAVCDPLRRPFVVDLPLKDAEGAPTQLVGTPGYGGGRAYGSDGSRLIGVDDRCLRTAIPCDVVWRADVPVPIDTMRLADGIVFATTRDDRVFAVPTDCGGAVTCAPAWWGAIPAVGSADPVVTGDVVFVPTAGEGVVAFPAGCRSDGGECEPSWRGSAGGVLTEAVIDGRTLFVGADAGDGTGRLVAFGLPPGADTSAGDARWALVTWGAILGAGVVVLSRRVRRDRTR